MDDDGARVHLLKEVNSETVDASASWTGIEKARMGKKHAVARAFVALRKAKRGRDENNILFVCKGGKGETSIVGQINSHSTSDRHREVAFSKERLEMGREDAGDSSSRSKRCVSFSI